MYDAVTSFGELNDETRTVESRIWDLLIPSVGYRDVAVWA